MAIRIECPNCETRFKATNQEHEKCPHCGLERHKSWPVVEEVDDKEEQNEIR